MALETNVPTIMVGKITSPGNQKNLSIILHHEGLLHYTKPGSCSSRDAISTSVYAAVAGIIEKLNEIGAQKLNILNGTCLENHRHVCCDPIPEDIFSEFAGRLTFYVQTYLTPAEAVV